MIREDIYAALFALVSTAPGLVTVSRKLRHWNDVQASEMPALFQAQGKQVPLQETNLLTRWELHGSFWIYVSTLDKASPGPVLNPIVDAIATMLAPGPGGRHQTLGGLVHYARLEGESTVSEGTLGDKEVVKIPFKILTL